MRAEKTEKTTDAEEEEEEEEEEEVKADKTEKTTEEDDEEANSANSLPLTGRQRRALIVRASLTPPGCPCFRCSTVVVIICSAVAAGSGFLQHHLHNAESVGALVGTAISAAVLFLIGTFNLCIAASLARQWRRVRQRARLQWRSNW